MTPQSFVTQSISRGKRSQIEFTKICHVGFKALVLDLLAPGFKTLMCINMYSTYASLGLARELQEERTQWFHDSSHPQKSASLTLKLSHSFSSRRSLSHLGTHFVLASAGMS